jgi:hypothetical protein
LPGKNFRRSCLISYRWKKTISWFIQDWWRSGWEAAIIAAPKKHRKSVGNVAASFFTAVFPGNIAHA